MSILSLLQMTAPPEFGPIVPLFPVRVQQRENENILEGEQARVEPIVEQRVDIQVEPIKLRKYPRYKSIFPCPLRR